MRIVSVFAAVALVLLTSCRLFSAAPTPSPAPTSMPTATRLPPTPTSTASPTRTPRPTITPNLEATEAYNGMAAYVQALLDQGYLDSPDGSYFPLADFEDEWAQIGWYQWDPTGYDPADFILRAHMAWSTDTHTPNPSGCGIIFRKQDDDSHYVIFVTTTGNLEFGVVSDRYRSSGGRGYFGPADSSGEADFVLLAVGDKFDVFIDGEHIRTYYGRSGDWLDGDLAYTVLSGTNAGYGTRCAITRSELWVLAP